MLDVAVIEDAAAAEATLDPLRARLLAELAEPGSASSLAARVGQPRQKVNYHLRELERHGLVELVEERRKGNMTERVLQATASSYVISPVALAAVAPDPKRSPDRLSARWMLAVAARLVSDVGALITGATRAGKRVATFALDGEVRFASAADRSAFAEELANAVTGLVGKYHAETEDLLAGSSIGTKDLLAGSSVGTEDLLAGSSISTVQTGRKYRIIVAIHPALDSRENKES